MKTFSGTATRRPVRSPALWVSVRVTVGSTNLITSNGTITMDTVAVNTNDRIYVPVRYIANALGASVSWDPATRTATFS